MIAIRGQIMESGGGALEHAERFHHVYMTDAGRHTALKVVDPTDPNAKLEMFLLDDMGQIRADKTFAATRLSKSADGALHAATTTLKVAGQMRDLYASRILQLAGHHLARIGVDFVDMPRQENKKKHKAPPSGTSSTS